MKGKTWVISGSRSNFFARKSATSFGTSSLLFHPAQGHGTLLSWPVHTTQGRAVSVPEQSPGSSLSVPSPSRPFPLLPLLWCSGANVARWTGERAPLFPVTTMLGGSVSILAPGANLLGQEACGQRAPPADGHRAEPGGLGLGAAEREKGRQSPGEGGQGKGKQGEPDSLQQSGSCRRGVGMRGAVLRPLGCHRCVGTRGRARGWGVWLCSNRYRLRLDRVWSPRDP